MSRLPFWGLLLLLSLYSLPVQAGLLPDCNPVPGVANNPNFVGPQETCQPKHLLELLVNVYNWLLGFAGILALLIIVWSGFRMLTFYISETPEKDLEAARYTLRRAVFGLFLVIVAYLFVNTIIGLLSGGTSSIDTILQKAGLN